MPKLLRRLMLALAAALLATGLLLAALYWAALQPPPFYEQSLARRPASEAASPERLEQQALALHNQLHHAGRFEARLTEDEINGWLAEELPRKFPRLLNAALSEPRVAIGEGKLRLAVRYQRGNVETVLSLAAEAHLTGQPNELAIRVSQVRAGLLPVPLGRWLADIQYRATRAGIPLQWSDEDGDPVALVCVPGEIEAAADGDGKSNEPHKFVLEDVRLEDAALVIVGRTETPISQPPDDPAPENTAGQSAESQTRQR